MASIVNRIKQHGTHHGSVIADEAWANTSLIRKMDLCMQLLLYRGAGVPTLWWLVLLCLHACLSGIFVGLAYSTTPNLDGGEDGWAYWDTMYYKFNAWLYILECIGCGMCFLNNGAKSWRFRYSPGMIKVPGCLLPSWTAGFRRTRLDVFLHLVSLLGACVMLVLPRVGARELYPVVSSELVSYILDYTPAHHQFYNFLPLLALCFSSESGGFAGAQLAILGLYFFAGLSKRPCWAQYNNAFFFAFSRWFVANDCVHGLIYTGSDNATLTRFSRSAVALSGLLVEAGGPLALMFGPLVGLPLVATLGFYVLIAMHVVIVTSMPLDIFTFNAYYVVSITYLFRWRFVTFDWEGASRMHPILAMLLILRVLYVIYGFARPESVHYLTQGWRIWGGNWTMSYVMLRKSAMVRLRAKVQSNIPEPSSEPNSVGLAFGLTYKWLTNLNGKALPVAISRMLQHANGDEDEYVVADLSELQAWMMGFWWGDVGVWDALRPFLVEECGFDDGDCCFFVVAAFTWLGNRTQVSMYDVHKGLISEVWYTIAQLEQVAARPSAGNAG